jgi:hypothetical protein
MYNVILPCPHYYDETYRDFEIFPGPDRPNEIRKDDDVQSFFPGYREHISLRNYMRAGDDVDFISSGLQS